MYVTHRFRNRAVGDQLRDVYNGLSRDPHSLANLDQDLPNFTQSSVRSSSGEVLSSDAVQLNFSLTGYSALDSDL